MGNNVTRDFHCHVTVSNDNAVYTYHDITMHNDVAMNIFYYVLLALCQFMLFYYG